MPNNFAGPRAGQTPRRSISTLAVITSCAAVTVLAIGGTAMASNSTAKTSASTITIKACYQTTASPSALKRVPSTAHCPRGYTGLTWNKVGPQGPQGPAGSQGPQGQQGPQGPAGVATGNADTSGTAVELNQAQTLTQVLSGGTAPSAGQYYVNASVMLIVAQGDTVTCILDDNGTATGVFATVGPVANQTYETLPLTGAITMSAGQHLGVLCSDYTGNSSTSFYDGAITSVLIANPAASSVRFGTAHRRPTRLSR